MVLVHAPCSGHFAKASFGLLDIETGGRAQLSQRVLGAAQRGARQRFCFAGDLLHLFELAVAVESDVAPRQHGRFFSHPQRSLKRRHGQIVAHQQTTKADLATNDAVNDARAGRCRAIGVDGLIDDMRRHRDRGMTEAAERDEIMRREFFGTGGDVGKRQMAVGQRTSVPRNMLDHRKHAAIQMTIQHNTAELDHRGGIQGESAVADDGVGAGNRYVEHGCAIHRHTQPSEVIGDEPRAQIGRLAPVIGAPLEQFAKPARGRPRTPMRRLEARDASPFLVDENGRPADPDRIAQGIAKRADLDRRLTIAGEQDETERLDVTEEFSLLGRQLHPLAAVNRCTRRHRNLIRFLGCLKGPPRNMSLLQP